MIFELNRLATAGDVRAQVQSVMDCLRQNGCAAGEEVLAWVERQRNAWNVA